MHSPQRVNIGSGPAEFKPLVAHSFSVWLVRRIVPDLRLVDFYFTELRALASDGSAAVRFR
jgi:hypothetical protein